MRIGTLLVVLAVALAVVSCKKKDEGSGGSAPPPAAQTPQVDCAKLVPKLNECADPFFAAFAATRQAKTTGGDDGAKGAEMWRGFMKGDMADQLCKDTWGAKDPRWLVRYNGCWATEACDAWAPCMADALGNLLPIP